MKLYKHQQEALIDTIDQDHVAYYHDMGLGKTFTGAEKMHQLNSNINLVICQKSKIDDWVDHFMAYYDWRVYNLTDIKNCGLEQFLQAAKTGPYQIVGIINYDLIFRRPDLLQLEDFTLMLDESSLIQHETSKRTKFVMKMKPKNVILLSGTPTGGKYEMLLSQMHLLGWNISEDLFWSQYVDWEWQEIDGFWQKKVLGYKNVDRLKRKMRKYGCNFLKTEEVLNLPEQIETKMRINPTIEYKRFVKESYVNIGDIELIGDSIGAKLANERRLCGQYNDDKLSAFQDLLRETEDRLVVFYNFTEEWHKLGKITDELGRPSSVVNGQFKCPEVLDNHDNGILFIQYQAGAMGLNLQKANKIIYFTPPLSSEIFEQSKKRIHRIGQNRSCFYYYLICRNSIEERIYQTLAMRKDYTEELFKEDSDGR